MKPERRYLTHEFRISQQGEAPKIAGYAAVFDVPSEDMGFIEEIDPHAFDAVLASKPDVCGLWNHNDDVVLGRTTSGTLRLAIDARGLAYEIDPPDTQAAKDLLVLMRRGDVNKSSFGFITKRDQWTDNPDGSVTRRILEIEALLDVSPVTYPAFTQTSADVRALPESMPAEYRSRIEKRALTDKCTCTCPQCMSGSCGICSADPQCEGAERTCPDSEMDGSRSYQAWHDTAMLNLRLQEAS
ncbi:MAG TPA: HK97 family phage prohead protease [Terracidiphilus sp.]|nr:HK97 family phage prohead protease [Terracidiphilus sp.]